ncbi:hypothetical protein KKB40_00350 [Patescibacteria group bacterium]|nr:hypothetical protein [Patescibacteria group bacterium]
MKKIHSKKHIALGIGLVFLLIFLFGCISDLCEGTKEVQVETWNIATDCSLPGLDTLSNNLYLHTPKIEGEKTPQDSLDIATTQGLEVVYLVLETKKELEDNINYEYDTPVNTQEGWVKCGKEKSAGHNINYIYCPTIELSKYDISESGTIGPNEGYKLTYVFDAKDVTFEKVSGAITPIFPAPAENSGYEMYKINGASQVSRKCEKQGYETEMKKYHYRC